MIKNLSTKIYFRRLSYLLVIGALLPVLTNNLPPIVGSYHLFAAIWILSIIFLNPIVLTQYLVRRFSIYVILNVGIFSFLIWGLMFEANKELIRREVYDIFIPLSILAYYQISDDKIGWARLTRLALICIGVTSVMTFYAASIEPMYARYMTANIFSIDRLEFFKRIGGGNYGFNNALLGIFAILIYIFKKGIFKKSIIYIYIFILYGAVLKMQFFANIVLALFTVVISISGLKKLRQSVIVLLLASLIFYSIPKKTYSDVLVSVSSLFDPSTEAYYKLLDISEYILGNDDNRNVVDARSARYPNLIESFIKSPFLGDSWHNDGTDISLGFHLYWMNRLALWGIFGFGIYIWFHYSYITYIIKHYDKQFAFYLRLGLLSILFYGLMKNISGREVWFAYFVIIPGVYYLPLLKKK